MAATSAVDHSRIRQAAPALKNISTSRVTELFQKVDWALVFGVTAAIGYLFYHLYKWSQFNSHSALGLDEPFRLVKCNVLLAEAREKEETSNVEPLLQECETLLDSMTDRSHSFVREPVVFELALFYVTKNPDRACQIAQKLSSDFDLIEVAQAIQKQHRDFDKSKLNALWEKAFEAAVDMKPRLYKIRRSTPSEWLEFAENFHVLGNATFKDRAFKKAVDLANGFKEPLRRVAAWRQVDKCYMKTGNIEGINQHIHSNSTIDQR